MGLSHEADLCRETYEAYFDANKYLSEMSGDDVYERFFNTSTFKAFSGATKEGKSFGPRCVDVGAGPTVHRLAIASRFCEVLYSSDLVKANRDAVMDFLESSSQVSSQRTLIKSIAKIEGFENLEEGTNIIEARLKSKLKGAVPCDVLSTNPLGDLKALGGPFDVVISSGCLETASTSYEEFQTGLRNISSLLNPGGALFLMTYLNEDYYETGGVSYPCIRVHQSTVEDGLRENGFEIEFLQRETDPRNNSEKSSNCEGYLFVMAYKSEVEKTEKPV